MFTKQVNNAFKQIVENRGMHETAQRLYEAASLLTGGLIHQQGEVAAFFGVSPQRLKNWEGRGISQQGMVSICEAKPINLSWLNKGEGPAPGPAPGEDASQAQPVATLQPEGIRQTVDRLGQLLATADERTRAAVAELLLRYAQNPADGERLAQAIEVLMQGAKKP